MRPMWWVLIRQLCKAITIQNNKSYFELVVVVVPDGGVVLPPEPPNTVEPVTPMIEGKNNRAAPMKTNPIGVPIGACVGASLCILNFITALTTAAGALGCAGGVAEAIGEMTNEAQVNSVRMSEVRFMELLLICLFSPKYSSSKREGYRNSIGRL